MIDNDIKVQAMREFYAMIDVRLADIVAKGTPIERIFLRTDARDRYKTQIVVDGRVVEEFILHIGAPAI